MLSQACHATSQFGGWRAIFFLIATAMLRKQKREDFKDIEAASV
jgi:hypothetical protein